MASNIPHYTILEWLSRRESFYVAEFKQRFYPESNSQTPHTRIQRLKQMGLVIKPLGLSEGIWLSNVKPEDLPTHLQPETIEDSTPINNPPVASSVSESDLPNPLIKPKQGENSRTENTPKRGKGKNSEGNSFACYHIEPNKTTLNQIKDFESKTIEAIEDQAQYDIMGANSKGWDAKRILSTFGITDTSRVTNILIELIKLRNVGNPSDYLETDRSLRTTDQEFADVLFLVSEHYRRKAYQAQKSNKTE